MKTEPENQSMYRPLAWSCATALLVGLAARGGATAGSCSGVGGTGSIVTCDTAWIRAFDANGTSPWSRGLGAAGPEALASDGTVGTLFTRPPPTAS